MKKQTNWAGNLTYQASRWYEPETQEEIIDIVKKSNKVRVVGSRHSFNDIADTEETIICLKKLNNVIELDQENLTVTVEAGIIYSDLGKYLQSNGFALENMASLPHISVAGACATATHGSGNDNNCLSTSVRSMDIITATGEIINLSREKDEEEMNGAIVGLGGLGVVTMLTLDVVPTFNIKQEVYENLSLETLKDNFESISASAYSVSLFTDWKDGMFNYVWLKHLVKENTDSIKADDDFYGASLSKENRHPIPGIEADHCTEQLGVVGPWLDRLPHFKMDFTPSNGEELQSEYILPRQHAFEALSAVNDIRDQLYPLLHISEIRTIASDDLWMSSCYKQESVGLHFTWKDNWEEVQQVLPKIEEVLAPFQARPHWGKLFTLAPEKVQSLYEKLPDFKQLLKKYDPNGKFRNKFMDSYIFGEK
ncbi:FAD-binding protein [Saliterribacillus persicus]|uniref:Xylitol oxidase n=1 Tax=Saliterribacillus persicus TaxID=930114 RepID=A0A368X7X3_9BACI|nr:FAD-binding protein [Saliterribacillus persicus]RCW63915.1 xylitol oxidase [Saliterribacillus persicus]